MDRNREESITVDTFSLEQPGSLLTKLNDSANVEFSSFEKSLSLKDYYHQPAEKNLAANDPQKLSRSVNSSQVATGSKETPEELPQCQIEIPNKDERCFVLMRKKAAERLLLLLLVSAISIGMLLAFCLTVGTAIHERSSNVGVDLTYDKACDSDGNLSMPHVYNDSCHVYESGICDSYLKTEGLTNLTTLHSTMISEDDVIAFFSALDIQSSASCQEASKPFICQHVFPPCHNNGDYELVTEEQCLHVQDEACPVEWLIAKSLFPNLLPDCRLLNGTNEVVGNSSNNCPDTFKLFCETCLPLCSIFSQYDETTTVIRRIVDIVAAITAIIGGVLLITLSAIKRKTMWQFPTVFIVYTATCPTLIAVFVIISHIDHNKNLYCSHKALTEAIKAPTVFCNISGAVFQFCIMLMSLFWLLHLFHIYLSVVFPIRSRILNTRRWSQRLHIIEVVGSVFISALCPAAVLVTNINYNFIFYPPLLCTPATQVSVFYSMAIPVVLFTVIGLNLIVTIVWTLFKRNGCLHNAITKHRCTLSTPEAKTVILLTFYIIFLSTSIIFVGRGISNARPFSENLFAYFICQSHGDDPACYVFQEEYYKYESAELTAAVFVMIGLINWINLLFAVQTQDLRFIMSKIAAKLFCVYETSIQFTFASSNSSGQAHSTTNSG